METARALNGSFQTNLVGLNARTEKDRVSRPIPHILQVHARPNTRYLDVIATMKMVTPAHWRSTWGHVGGSPLHIKIDTTSDETKIH